MLTSHCTSCRCWIYTRSVSTVLWTCSWDSKMPHLCSHWFLIARSTDTEYFLLFQKVDTLNIPNFWYIWKETQSSESEEKLMVFHFLTRMALEVKSISLERLSRLSWPLQCSQDFIIPNLYFLHSLDHDVVCQGQLFTQYTKRSGGIAFWKHCVGAPLNNSDWKI